MHFWEGFCCGIKAEQSKVLGQERACPQSCCHPADTEQSFFSHNRKFREISVFCGHLCMNTTPPVRGQDALALRAGPACCGQQRCRGLRAALPVVRHRRRGQSHAGEGRLPGGIKRQLRVPRNAAPAPYLRRAPWRESGPPRRRSAGRCRSALTPIAGVNAAAPAPPAGSRRRPAVPLPAGTAPRRDVGPLSSPSRPLPGRGRAGGGGGAGGAAALEGLERACALRDGALPRHRGPARAPIGCFPRQARVRGASLPTALAGARAARAVRRCHSCPRAAPRPRRAPCPRPAPRPRQLRSAAGGFLLPSPPPAVPRPAPAAAAARVPPPAPALR